MQSEVHHLHLVPLLPQKLQARFIVHNRRGNYIS
jgi:hypothetical protein